MRDKLWYNLLDVKFKSFYYDELVTNYQITNRRINVFLAFTSSASIASWAIWNQLNFLWGLIIAASTIINVIKPYFPFSKYIREISRISVQLDNLSWEYEKLWYNYENGRHIDDECFTLFMELKKRAIDILKFSEETIINENTIIEEKANNLMDIYLRNNFSIQHKSNEVK